MSEKKRPPLRIVPGGANGAKPPSAERVEAPKASLRDILFVALVCAALVLAPLWAGEFPTLSHGAGALGGLYSIWQLMGTSFVLVLIALAGLLGAWRERENPSATPGVPGLAGAALFLGGWAALSMVRSQALHRSLDALALLWAALLLGALTMRAARVRNGLTALMLSVIVAGSLVAALGVREYLEAWKEGDVEHRVFASFLNPDFAAGYLLLTLPLTLSAFVAAKESLASACLGFGLALQSACVLLTASRAGVGVLLVALVGWLILVQSSRSATGRGKRMIAAGALLAVGALPASGPTLARVIGRHDKAGSGAGVVASARVAAQEQSHSNAFRRYTWMGALKMAQRNPLLGTGVGTFEVAYPRYAITAFTAHAHNSYLQLAGETGVPGLLALLALLASASAFAARALFSQHREPDFVASSPLFASPPLLLSGLLAGFAASMMHSLIDSDWYVVATAATLAAVVGLMAAQAREIAPLPIEAPRFPAWALPAGMVAVSLLILVRAGMTGPSRLALGEGDDRVREAMSNPSERSGALSLGLAYRNAMMEDPLDPEPRLALAQVVDDKTERETRLKEATQLANVGKTWYRLGQFYAQTGDNSKAVAAFRRARECEPNNVQNLRALANALLGDAEAPAHPTDPGPKFALLNTAVFDAPDKDSRFAEASEVYRTMEKLENGPYGKVRAVQEVAETDFAYAHAALADIAYSQGRYADAAAEYARAADVLRFFWRRRGLTTNALVADWKRNRLTALYGAVLNYEKDAFDQLHSPEAARVVKELDMFRQGTEADKLHR